MGEDLQGVILASPITDFDAATQSAIENSKKDWIDQSAIKTWGDNYAGHGVRDIYINPGLASEEWWKEIRVKKAIVLYGEYELARDSIETWVTKFKVRLARHKSSAHRARLRRVTETQSGDNSDTWEGRIPRTTGHGPYAGLQSTEQASGGIKIMVDTIFVVIKDLYTIDIIRYLIIIDLILVSLGNLCSISGENMPKK